MPASTSLSFGPRPVTILVTGATGFVGTNLVRDLLADHHDIIVLSREPARARNRLGHQVRCIRRMDDLPPDARVDVIINLAGARILGWRWSAQRKQVLLASRVGVTQGIVDWIARAQHKPQLMLSASAVGYYGIQPRSDFTPLTEDAPTQSIFMSQLCRQWEESARAARDHGVTVACMRFGMVLGHGGALPPMLAPVKFGLGGPLGDGNQTLAWIHIHDLIRAIAHLMQGHAQGKQLAPAYNFTAPQLTSQATFLGTAARLLDRPFLLRTPAWPVRLALGEQADIILEGQHVVPHQLQQEGFTFRYATAEDALRSLL